jgi:hypothetical protein
LTSSCGSPGEETGSEGIACASAIRNLCTIQHEKDITNAARESAGNYEADDAPRRGGCRDGCQLSLTQADAR